MRKRKDKIVEEMFLKDAIYKPLHTKQKPAGKYERRKRSKDENDEPLYLDKSKPGGRFIVDGQLVNAHREFIDEAGKFTGGRLPEKDSIKVIVLEKDYWLVKEKQNSEGRVIERLAKLVKPKRLTSEMMTKKANEILKEIEPKYLPRIEQADKNYIEKVIEEGYSEVNQKLTDWMQEKLQSRQGRDKGSLNKNPLIKLSEIENFIRQFSESEGKPPTQPNVISRFPKWSDRTLRRFIKDNFGVKWKEYCKKVLEK